MDEENKIRSIRSQTGLSQQAFADRYHIPKRTIENWERRINEPPAYVVELLQFRIDNE